MKHKITDKWYVPQVLNESGEWVDIADMNFSRREASNEMCLVNCYGRKARIIERIAAFKVVAEKDFTKK